MNGKRKIEKVKMGNRKLGGAIACFLALGQGDRRLMPDASRDLNLKFKYYGKDIHKNRR